MGAMVVERKYFTCLSRESNPCRWINRQTIYHVPVKAGFYRKAEEYLYIPRPCDIIIPPTAKVIWEQGYRLKSTLTEGSVLQAVVYETSGLSTTPQQLLEYIHQQPTSYHSGTWDRTRSLKVALKTDFETLYADKR